MCLNRLGIGSVRFQSWFISLTDGLFCGVCPDRHRESILSVNHRRGKHNTNTNTQQQFSLVENRRDIGSWEGGQCFISNDCSLHSLLTTLESYHSGFTLMCFHLYIAAVLWLKIRIPLLIRQESRLPGAFGFGKVEMSLWNTDLVVHISMQQNPFPTLSWRCLLELATSVPNDVSTWSTQWLHFTDAT